MRKLIGAIPRQIIHVNLAKVESIKISGNMHTATLRMDSGDLIYVDENSLKEVLEYFNIGGDNAAS